jgi:ribosomal protein S15P/S13E
VNTRVNEIRDEMAKAKDDKISAAIDAALALEQLAEVRTHDDPRPSSHQVMRLMISG